MDWLGYTAMKVLLPEGDCGATSAKGENIFAGGSDKVVQLVDHVFHVECAEAHRRTPHLLQGWQSKPSDWTSLTG